MKKFYRSMSIALGASLFFATVTPSFAEGINSDTDVPTGIEETLVTEDEIIIDDLETEDTILVDEDGVSLEEDDLTIGEDNVFLDEEEDEWVWEFEYDSVEDVPQELLEPGYIPEDEIVVIPEEYLNPYHEDTIDTVYGNFDGTQVGPQSRAVQAAAGLYFIPGVGQALITATGAVIIGGVTIKAGSWLYSKVSAYFSKKAAEKAADKIPDKLKSADMKVNLGKFKDKNGNTPKDKSSGTFTNGKWKITKDTAGHLGYNGNKKAWKIGNPGKVASLDKAGNVIGK